MAAQMRFSAVGRSGNFLTRATPGIRFHNCTKRALGQLAVAALVGAPSGRCVPDRARGLPDVRRCPQMSGFRAKLRVAVK